MQPEHLPSQNPPGYMKSIQCLGIRSLDSEPVTLWRRFEVLGCGSCETKERKQWHSDPHMHFIRQSRSGQVVDILSSGQCIDCRSAESPTPCGLLSHSKGFNSSIACSPSV